MELTHQPVKKWRDAVNRMTHQELETPYKRILPDGRLLNNAFNVLINNGQLRLSL